MTVLTLARFLDRAGPDDDGLARFWLFWAEADRAAAVDPEQLAAARAAGGGDEAWGVFGSDDSSDTDGEEGEEGDDTTAPQLVDVGGGGGGGRTVGSVEYWQALLPLPLQASWRHTAVHRTGRAP